MTNPSELVGKQNLISFIHVFMDLYIQARKLKTKTNSLTRLKADGVYFSRLDSLEFALVFLFFISFHFI